MPSIVGCRVLRVRLVAEIELRYATVTCKHRLAFRAFLRSRQPLLQRVLFLCPSPPLKNSVL